MSNPIPVRFPCEEHNQWFRHMVKPVGVKPVWCDGGTRRLLIQKYAEVFEDDGTFHEQDVWVEVEHD